LTRQNLDVTWEDSRLLAAPLRIVWQLHTDINSWPTWNGEVLAARLDGPLPELLYRHNRCRLLADTDLRPR
jgi:hypothetical protein